MKKWQNAEVIELDVTETSCGWPWYIPRCPEKKVEIITIPEQPPVIEEPPVVDLKS